MSAEVENILRSFWEWRLKESPEFATQIGVHTYDKSLDDHSLGAYAKRQEDCRDFIKKLKAVAKSELSKSDALNVKLLQREIEMYLDGSKHKSYLFPLINLEGPQLEFSRLVSWMKFETQEDYEKYFSRLEAFPTQASQLIALLQEGVRTHYVPPHLTVSHVPEQIKKVLNVEITGDNHIFTPLKKFPETFSEEERASFKERGIKLIEEKVKPAFQKIHDYYFDKYLRQTRDSISCTNFPNGTEFYKQALKFHIACDMTVQEVHDLGQNEVKRIRSRMDKIIKDVGFEGSFKEFLEMLRTEKRFYYDTKEELLNGYKGLCEKIIKPKLKDYFKEIPKTPFEIIETPADAAPVAPAAFYMGPSEDGSRPGVFMVNTYKHNTRPKYEMVSLALHEAAPGHHLQTAFAMEQEEQPSFRRHVEDRRYYEVPARFALNTAYMEGWGLYCEYLGEEMGLYKDPYDLFGRLSTEILRACRLVVDTGMHAFGWSRQQAVDFMVENTAMSLHNVNTEVDRYIIWPGQACAYKVGEIKIKELRRKAEQNLGDKFDIKDYHHVFLSAGPMGLDTLEEAVDEYIDNTLARFIFTDNSTKSAEVENILRSFWEWRLKESPEFATQIGVHTYDKSLDDHSLSAYAKRQDYCRDFITKLKAIAKSKLSKNDALNVKLLQREIETYLDGSKHKSYLFPLINLEGPQLKFPRLVSWMKFETQEDYEKYFSRLEAFPTQASEFMALLKEGVRTHYVPPHLTVSHVPEQIKKVLDADIVGDNHLFTPLKKFPETFSEKERASFKERGIKLIEEKVKPAFQKIHDYYLEKYLHQTRDSISCTNFPNGTEFYKQALKFHIACDMTAEEVHDLGQNEVKRIRSRMDKIIKEVGFEGSFKEFLEMLRTEKRFYYDTKEELLNGYKGLCEKIIKSKIKDYFKEIPKTPFEIIEMPADLAPVASAAFYLRPSEGGSRPGVFMVNTYKHNIRPKYEMVALALHEAVPGHHLQTAFAMEKEEQPSFRRHVDDRRYYEVPARFPFNTAYMEGWGLYCEYLGEEMGLYKDLYDLFGRLSIEILRACRLVVDTGMHAFGWSRQQAVDFMIENTATSLHNVNTEVDRYIIWPGQACAYKVGEIKIKELRRKAEQKLGDNFDIKDYHHVFLSAGPMDLDTLEEAVDEYIDNTLAQ